MAEVQFQWELWQLDGTGISPTLVEIVWSHETLNQWIYVSPTHPNTKRWVFGKAFGNDQLMAFKVMHHEQPTNLGQATWKWRSWCTQGVQCKKPAPIGSAVMRKAEAQEALHGWIPAFEGLKPSSYRLFVLKRVVNYVLKNKPHIFGGLSEYLCNESQLCQSLNATILFWVVVNHFLWYTQQGPHLKPTYKFHHLSKEHLQTKILSPFLII